MKEKLVSLCFCTNASEQEKHDPCKPYFFLSFTGCNVYLSGRWETD